MNEKEKGFFTVDTSFLLCYNPLDNRIVISWQAGRVAMSAEQDNRVRIPNGTAAVKSKLRHLVKTGHWKQFREGCGKAWEAPPE